MENAPPTAAQAKLDRSALMALAVPVGGFIVLAVALVVLATRAAQMLSVGAFWALMGLGVFGFAVFLFGLSRLSGERQLRLSLENAKLTQANADLTQRNATLDAAKRETDTILGAMPASVLTIDSEYRIGGRYTRELDSVLRSGALGDENFLSILRGLLPEASFEVARTYLATFFDPAANGGDPAGPNPLANVEVIVTTPSGAKQLRTLSFVVRRAAEAGADAHALIWIEDTTGRVQRERRERELDAVKAKQFDLLTGILHVEPEALDAFVRGATERLRSIDEALRAGDAPLGSGQSALFRQRLETILQHIDAIKSSAGALRLGYFEARATDYEVKIAELKTRDALRGDDFLALVMEQSAFRAELDDLQAVRTRLTEPVEDSTASSVAPSQAPRQTPASDDSAIDLGAAVSQLANERARELGKQVVVSASGLDSQTLSPERRALVKDVLLELTRNAVDHGIEDPSVREASGKPRAGTIAIAPANASAAGAFGLTFRDDGRGLDTAAIREKAVAAGLIDARRASSIDDSEVAGFMFSPALGTGLSTVKRRVVDDCGGSISVDSENGSFSEFSFELPPG
jgi:signal transduction histidine kinase